jgi:hypothetical protein
MLAVIAAIAADPRRRFPGNGRHSAKEATMCADSAVRAILPGCIEALLDDPLVRIVMHADGVTTGDILAALQIAYQATSDHEPAPRSWSPCHVGPSSQTYDPFGHWAASGLLHL